MDNKYSDMRKMAGSMERSHNAKYFKGMEPLYELYILMNYLRYCAESASEEILQHALENDFRDEGNKSHLQRAQYYISELHNVLQRINEKKGGYYEISREDNKSA